jgi:uncharacterized protein (TIGR03435 family)
MLRTRRFASATVIGAILAVSLLGGLVSVQILSAQEAADWEKLAGGKMSFDVASVKPVKVGPVFYPHSNFPFDDSATYTATGGLLSATEVSVAGCIRFAYKLRSIDATRVELPSWARALRFDIEARGPASATKDQMRLMMQSLLADRFKLTLHREMRDLPVFALVAVKAGKIGPKIEIHSDYPPCADPAHPGPSATPKGYPFSCGSVGMRYLTSQPWGPQRVFGRKVTMQQIVDSLQLQPGVAVGRPIVDGTGLNGEFDFVMDFMPEAPRGADDQSAIDVPSFVEALKDQLGFRLEATTGELTYLVIDHVEEPSPN